VLVLTESDVDALIDLDDLADAMRAALRGISDGSASTPPRVAAESPLGMLGAMPGYLPGIGLGAKLVTYFRGNADRGLPGHQALIVLADPDDGGLLATMGATRITGIRTAMTAAVAARVLAPTDARRIVVVGTGAQARSHLEAFGHLFPAAQRTLTGRSADRVRALATEYAGTAVVADVASAVAEADIVCLCTDSDRPVVRRGWLRAGCHVSSVGSGEEVDAETIEAASVFVEARAVATRPFPAGSRELAGRDPGALTEVGEVLIGARPGRRLVDELTVYKSMGHATEDVAAAALVYRAALTAGRGTPIAL
jgi:ornithine cyclodeaminase